MSEVLSAKSLYVPKWDGKGSKFQLWWTRFSAFATVCWFSIALGSVKDPEMPATEAEVLAEDDAGKKKLAAKEANFSTMAQLTMAFTTESAMTFIYDGMVNQDWPSGLVYLVVNAIKKKHLPNDMITKVELRRMITGITMKKSEDLVTLFNQIAAVRVKYNRPGAPVDPEEFIAIVIAQAPASYQGVLISEQLRQGTSFTLKHLATAMNMNMQWRAMGGNLANGNDDGEIALVSFNGVCFVCKLKGHRAFQCLNRSAATAGPSQPGGKPKYDHCHKPGHVEAKC
jgi:hypothetical protein